MNDIEKLDQAIKLIEEVSKSCEARHSAVLRMGIPLSTNEVGWAAVNLEFAGRNLKDMVKADGRLTYLKKIVEGAGDHGKEERKEDGTGASAAAAPTPARTIGPV